MSNAHLIERLQVPIAGNSHLAEVVSVQDPDSQGRVQIRLLAYDGVADQDAPIWARVSVPFAGDSRGAFLIPDVGDEVLVTFVNGDTRFPVVIGSLWNGGTEIPESLPGNAVDRWSLTGKAGTRIAIEEESASAARISFTTPNGISGELTDSAGGSIEFRTDQGTSVKLDNTGGVTVTTSANVKIEATLVNVSASMVKVDAGMSIFSGVVKADTVIANSIVSSSYTPGAGNIW